MKLTTDSPVSPNIEFIGDAALAIWGNGTVKIYRKVGQSPFLPLTDASGEEVEFSGLSDTDVVFNSDITNNSTQVAYQIRLVDGESVNFSWKGEV